MQQQPPASVVLVTSLFAVAGKRPWTVYVRDGWLGNLFAVATPFVFFGDDVTVPAVRAAVENVRPRD